jgi:hypothetical protein
VHCFLSATTVKAYLQSWVLVCCDSSLARKLLRLYMGELTTIHKRQKNTAKNRCVPPKSVKRECPTSPHESYHFIPLYWLVNRYPHHRLS